MKTIATLLVTAAALTAPVLGFAQSADQGLTRAQVRAELVQLEQAGYNPLTAADARYPQDIQVAEANVAATGDTTSPANTAAATQTDNAVGGMSESGKSDSGKHVPYSKPSQTCVGPVSYCNIFFGS
ncbi:DUF4148 domain-containing protein [Paraburkholderia humisilvae]|uniref:DUF4148 domain-containing protein n=1 Tax=Paraburkholderia humisilvae TaxID=627669 RepID=A0A6J5E798_9BURK|nr:DUF4148 domain-containing protein [Paraburkholderia humisilvae]CAB3762223.1 hypothetical protein LMG29542_04303 [Paraburkholderia humisilvae]